MSAISVSPHHDQPKDFDIVVVGELNVDLILSGDVTPAFGQIEKLVDDAVMTIGSSSAIFACGAARLGLRVAFIGKVGDDPFGQFLIRELTARAIDTSGIIVDSTVKTGLSVHLSRTTDRAILTYSGSIGALRYDEIDTVLLRRCRHLHLGSYFLLDALRPNVEVLFRLAHDLNLTTSLDTNYDPRENWKDGLVDTLKVTDVFLPNLTELTAIIGLKDLNSALDSVAPIVPLVAVKLGAQGAIARCQMETHQAQSILVSVVDTTGAGDSFDAGFIYGYLVGWTVERSLQLGCVCGALSTQAFGGTAAQPTLAESTFLLESL